MNSENQTCECDDHPGMDCDSYVVRIQAAMSYVVRIQANS